MKLINSNKTLSVSRRISQGIGLALGCLGIVIPSMTHVIFPGLHCYACPLAITICPVGIMQNLVKTGFPLFPLAFLGVYGVLLGRWWCGWICPFGLINDIFLLLNSKEKTKQITTFGTGILFTVLFVWVFISSYNRWFLIIPGIFILFILLVLTVPYLSSGLKRKINSRKFTGILYLVFTCLFPVVLFSDTRSMMVLVPASIFFMLVLLSGIIFYFIKKKAFILKFIILVLTIGLAAIAADTLFCKLCPSAALSASLPYLFIDPSFVPAGMYWIKLGILIFIAMCLLLVSRFFCRYLCPLGALFGLTNKISLLKITRHPGCDSADKKICRYACLNSCIMGIKDIHKQKVLTQTDCIKCGKCIEACPHSHLRFSIKTASRDSTPDVSLVE